MSHPHPAEAESPPSTRERIIAATLRLLEGTPVTGIRMRDVAAEAELSASSIYVHFGSRSELLRAVWRAEVDALTDRCEEALDVRSSGIDGLVAFGYAVFNDFSGYVRNRARLLEFIQADGGDEETARLVNESRARLRELLRRSLSHGDPLRDASRYDRLAELVLDATDGIALAELHDGNRHSAEELFGELLALIEAAGAPPIFDVSGE